MRVDDDITGERITINKENIKMKLMEKQTVAEQKRPMYLVGEKPAALQSLQHNRYQHSQQLGGQQQSRSNYSITNISLNKKQQNKHHKPQRNQTIIQPSQHHHASSQQTTI